mmetsp:Transcript_47741/g.123231  ORF Transcript_47741/g.123231 Transcript_47741/m.123231 type:complete len:322 (-) Transcript_47741:31-996(-)
MPHVRSVESDRWRRDRAAKRGFLLRHPVYSDYTHIRARADMAPRVKVIARGLAAHADLNVKTNIPQQRLADAAVAAKPTIPETVFHKLMALNRQVGRAKHDFSGKRAPRDSWADVSEAADAGASPPPPVPAEALVAGAGAEEENHLHLTAKVQIVILVNGFTVDLLKLKDKLLSSIDTVMMDPLVSPPRVTPKGMPDDSAKENLDEPPRVASTAPREPPLVVEVGSAEEKDSDEPPRVASASTLAPPRATKSSSAKKEIPYEPPRMAPTVEHKRRASTSTVRPPPPESENALMTVNGPSATTCLRVVQQNMNSLRLGSGLC